MGSCDRFHVHEWLKLIEGDQRSDECVMDNIIGLQIYDFFMRGVLCVELGATSSQLPCLLVNLLESGVLLRIRSPPCSHGVNS